MFIFWFYYLFEFFLFSKRPELEKTGYAIAYLKKGKT